MNKKELCMVPMIAAFLIAPRKQTLIRFQHRQKQTLIRFQHRQCRTFNIILKWIVQP